MTPYNFKMSTISLNTNDMSIFQTILSTRDYFDICESIDTLQIPPHVYDCDIDVDMEAENRCIKHVKTQILALPEDELEIIIETYACLDFAAWSMAGLEGC